MIKERIKKLGYERVGVGAGESYRKQVDQFQYSPTYVQFVELKPESNMLGGSVNPYRIVSGKEIPAILTLKEVILFSIRLIELNIERKIDGRRRIRSERK